MTRGQEARNQIKSVHCLVIDRVYFFMNEYDIYFHLVKQKMYISFVASHLE